MDKTIVSLPTFLQNPWGLVLPSKVLGKTRHLWIWSEQPSTGKTTQFAELLVNANCGSIQTNFSSWGVGLKDSVVILDDYNSPCLKLQTLNQMCDGSFQYNVKYLKPYKLNHPLVIVLSNKPPEQLYTKQYELLYARFRVFRVDNGNTYSMSIQKNNLIFNQ